jgi:hypothetical protein
MYVTLGNMLLNEWDFVAPQLYNQGGDGFWVRYSGFSLCGVSDLCLLMGCSNGFRGLDHVYFVDSMSLQPKAV